MAGLPLTELISPVVKAAQDGTAPSFSVLLTMLIRIPLAGWMLVE